MPASINIAFSEDIRERTGTNTVCSVFVIKGQISVNAQVHVILRRTHEKKIQTHETLSNKLQTSDDLIFPGVSSRNLQISVGIQMPSVSAAWSASLLKIAKDIKETAIQTPSQVMPFCASFEFTRQNDTTI